jgi:PleD family two-component response regulator
LQFRGEKFGVIELIHKISGAFARQDPGVPRIIVSSACDCHSNAGSVRRTGKQTITVDLTKLYNYRYLMQYHEAAVKRCQRNKEKVSLLFVDVDGFKRINSRLI